MSSTILYKFRSGTTFEALPLPGSAARLFDVKKAIVTAKKLDQGAIEFDLSIRDATTNEEYTDESMLLPRGTRVVVQRLPAAKGRGFLARMARGQQAGGGPPLAAEVPSAPISASANFYTIDSRAHDEDEEFVSSSTTAEEKELAALRAATDTASAAANGAVRSMRPSGFRTSGPAGLGPPPRAGQNIYNSANARPQRQADPELRDQEKATQPKKRATGIPRTFLNLNAPPRTDGEGIDGESNSLMLQPNTHGFKELVNRAGGQSENTAGTKKDLDYALKITSTTIPEYLVCAICESVVRYAMMLPWDTEGRTTCESCIRDALTKSGFVCPLTGLEGVSPDDLLPNHALRKAADVFMKGVMEKIDEIERDHDDEDVVVTEPIRGTSNILEGSNADAGVLVSKKSLLEKSRQSYDSFGGDDDFGGDVFAVAKKAPTQDDTEEATNGDNQEAEKTNELTKGPDIVLESTVAEKSEVPVPQPSDPRPKKNGPTVKEVETPHTNGNDESKSPKSDRNSPVEAPKREKRRAPPVGYAMGPAGGAAGGPLEPKTDTGGRDRAAPGRSGGRFDAKKHDERGFYRAGRDTSGRFGGRHEDRYSGPPHDDVSGVCVYVCICLYMFCSFFISDKRHSAAHHLGVSIRCFVTWPFRYTEDGLDRILRPSICSTS
jgi:hypothetical protein